MAKVPRLFLQTIEVEGPVSEWPPASHEALGLTDTTAANAEGARAVFAKLLPRAYRRPVQPGETERLVNVVMSAPCRSIDACRFIDAFAHGGMQTMLCSPAFLYLQEPNPESLKQTVRPVNDYELANRLSYFLWSSMPDEELFKLAATGKLKEPATLSAQVTRLLASPKARGFVENFAGQWLGVREFGSVKAGSQGYGARQP